MDGRPCDCRRRRDDQRRDIRIIKLTDALAGKAKQEEDRPSPGKRALACSPYAAATPRETRGQ